MNPVKEIVGVPLGKEGEGTLRAHMVRGTEGPSPLKSPAPSSAWSSPRPAFARSGDTWGCRPGGFQLREGAMAYKGKARWEARRGGRMHDSRPGSLALRR